MSTPTDPYNSRDRAPSQAEDILAPLPDGAVPRVRRRRADAIMGVLLALGLWYLSAWGATPSVTLGANL